MVRPAEGLATDRAAAIGNRSVLPMTPERRHG
jgi:hypothetical protein